MTIITRGPRTLELDGAVISTLEELRHHPSTELWDVHADGRLARWLRRQGATSEAEAVAAFRPSGDRAADIAALGGILGMDLDPEDVRDALEEEARERRDAAGGPEAESPRGEDPFGESAAGAAREGLNALRGVLEGLTSGREDAAGAWDAVIGMAEGMRAEIARRREGSRRLTPDEIRRMAEEMWRAKGRDGREGRRVAVVRDADDGA